MGTIYKPVDESFHKELETLVAQKAHLRIQYYTDINEFITLHATIKNLVKKGEEEYLQLSTGEEVRLDRIVRVGTKPAPGYDEEYFKCDC